VPGKNKAFAFVLILYMLSVCCRLPVLNRPLSKHHEFNPATVLIAVEAWQQRGGAAKFGYVPFINYSNPGDYMKDTRWALDGKGNGIYLSYGPGMYAIPYWFFALLHLKATPLALQVLNLLFLLAATYLFFQLLWFVFSSINSQGWLTIAGCIFFLFSPCILWFLGNGYVNVTISLPFLIGIIHQSLVILYRPKQTLLRHYVGLSFFIIVGLFIDWDAFLASVVIAFVNIYQSIKKRRFPMLAVVAGVSAFAGIFIILFLYSRYLPLEVIVKYWKERFFTRSVEDTGLNLLQKLGYLAANFLSGYLSILLCAIYIFITREKGSWKKISRLPVAYACISGTACLLYNLTFFNWSYIHDFSLVPFSIFLAFTVVLLCVNDKQVKQLGWLLPAYCVLSLFQFYFINRPGKASQNGTPYNVYQKLREQIKLQVQPDEMIFMKSQSPILNYYAKRFTFMAHSEAEAKQYLQQWHFTKGV
jgi:hypothetical protein